MLDEMASGLLLPYLDGTRWHSDGTAEWVPRPARMEPDGPDGPASTGC